MESFVEPQILLKTNICLLCLLFGLSCYEVITSEYLRCISQEDLTFTCRYFRSWLTFYFVYFNFESSILSQMRFTSWRWKVSDRTCIVKPLLEGTLCLAGWKDTALLWIAACACWNNKTLGSGNHGWHRLYERISLAVIHPQSDVFSFITHLSCYSQSLSEQKCWSVCG